MTGEDSPRSWIDFAQQSGLVSRPMKAEFDAADACEQAC